MELTSKALCLPRFGTLTLASGDTARIRLMTGKDRDEFGEWIKATDGTFQQMYCGYLSRYLVDANGAAEFSDAASLMEAPAATVEELFRLALIANGLKREGAEEAKKE